MLSSYAGILTHKTLCVCTSDINVSLSPDFEKIQKLIADTRLQLVHFF